MAIADVLILEQAGVAPVDTTVTFSARSGRTIVMRHAAPDNAIFAILEIPGDTAGRGETTLRMEQLPGRYGVRLSATPAWPRGVTLTFSYAIHFQAPDGTNKHYLGRSFYEAALGIGLVLPDGRLDFEPTERPAADMLRTLALVPGEYLVAAPR